MISIVVCSADEEHFRNFNDSVEATIGVPFEIIKIDNSSSVYSLCEAYNIGKALCRYDIICFSHEDIFFETRNWGNVFVDILKDKTIGMAGVFGICYFSLFPQGWYDVNELEGQLIVGSIENHPVNRHIRFPSDSIAEVAGVDGMFMVTRKDVIDPLSFDEQLLKGFHGYDIDINMQIRQHYKIVVTRDVMLYHESGGTYNESFFDSMKLIERKWKNHFPVYIPSYSPNEIRELKIKCLQTYYNRMNGKRRHFEKHLVALQYAIRQKVLFPWLKRSLAENFTTNMGA